MVLKFKTPANVMLIGPSLSGKSTMMFIILLQKDSIFDKPVGKVYYCYGIFSRAYHLIKEQLKDDIDFYPGLPLEHQLRTWSTESGDLPIVVVLDDLMEEISKSVIAQDLVTKLTHHCEMVLFILTQNMYQKGPIFRCLSLNTHYFILMKSKRDQQQLLYFGRQVFPFRKNYLYCSYQMATQSEQYGALRVDLHPATNPQLVLTSQFLSEYPIVYLDSQESDDIKYVMI